ncbi:MAG: hypothetical protein RXQ80_06960 [Sulfolobaceae archaeon]
MVWDHKKIEIFSLLLLTSFLVIASTITVSNITTASGPHTEYIIMGIYIIAQNANKLQIISINSVIETISLSLYSSAVPFKITKCDGDFYIVKNSQINI